MANKRRTQRRKGGVPQRGFKPLPPAETPKPVPSKSGIMRAGERLVNSAVDSALENLWSVIFSFLGSATMTAAVAIILYFRAPQSEWLYALLKYAVVFMGGFLAFASILVLLALVGIRRRRAREGQRLNKYVSTVKGPIDYRAEMGPAITRMQTVLNEIGIETIGLGERIGQMVLTTGTLTDPILQQKAASKDATYLNKHCLRIEKAAERLVEVMDAVLETTGGLLEHANSASEGNRPQLMEVQNALIVLDDAMDTVIKTQEKMRQSAQAAYGKVSMDVHTSLNWIMATNQQIIGIMQPFKERLALHLVPLLDRKLRS